MDRHLALIALLLANALPALAQKRYVPSVRAAQREERDEDHTRDPSQDTAVALTEALGDSLNHGFFPKNEIQGDLEWFIKRLDKELERFSDLPRYDILENAMQTERLGGDGYRDLVEKALKPLGGQAGPEIDQTLIKLRTMSDQLAQTRGDIEAVAQQIQQAFQPLSDNPITGNLANINASQLQRAQTQAQRIKDLLENLREQVKQADRKVDRAKLGVDQAKNMKDQLKGQAPGSVREAYRLDEAAIRGATQNKASGRSNTDGVNALSGPVVEKIAQRMEAAQQKAEKAQEAAKKISDEDPQRGELMKAIAATEKAAEAVLSASESGQRGATTVSQNGQELKSLEGQPPPDGAEDRARQLYSAAKDANQRAQDDKEKAVEALEGVERVLAKVEKQWEDVKDKLIGRLDGGESELNGRLPVPLPPTPMRAPQPKKPQQLRPGSNQQQMQRAVRSRPMRYPDSLGRDAQTIIRGEFGTTGTLSPTQ